MLTSEDFNRAKEALTKAYVPMSGFSIPSISNAVSYSTIALDDFVVYESSSMAVNPTPCCKEPTPKKRGCKKEAPMGRYCDEDCYVDAIPAQTDLATARDYLSARLSDEASDKRHELSKTFYLEDDKRPQTVKEMLERIAAGKFIAPDEKVDADRADRPYSYSPFTAIVWRDPTKPADPDGYVAAVKVASEAEQNARDVIRTGTEKDGLAALQAFQTTTFH